MSRKQLIRVVVLGLSFWTLAIPACTKNVARAPHPGDLSPAQTQADFDTMRKALEEGHTGLYRYVPKPAMDRVFAAERAKLDHPMSKLEFLAVLMETTAAIRCGHTGVQPDAETQAAFAAAPSFPLKLVIENQRLFVLANETPNDSTIQPGMEILEINGRTTREILDRILLKMSGDGDIETGKWRRLEANFSRDYWFLVDQAKEFTITARGGDGKTISARLVGVTAEQRKNNQNPISSATNAKLHTLDWSPGNLSLRFLKDPEIAEIRIPGFGGADYPQ